ncbi:phosphotransferase [Pseudoalteromonas sp. MMG010]|uniref:aminoglycoside phosphotransferase family protein n=1 Tax=Pseudoalteromonas sp. MMG010 TaxID=2822685 RepID=UPI001B39F152|nr:phosphotransferase [Pseudoalteromonas sp. MMG010]MBQ4832884.1 phosphotransferase [Pseudoalteromonas sp. MMG010]
MTRIEHLKKFITKYFDGQAYELEAITGDASFRRYFRVATSTQQLIVMDSDPHKVNNLPYITLNKVFTKQGFLLPEILASDQEQGFFILTDLGQTHLADLLEDEHREDYYQQLITLNAQWAQTPPASIMLPYDQAFIKRELDIFSQWLVADFINIEINEKQQSLWQQSCHLLIKTMLEQPQVTMHRDYHSRNIMRCNQQWAIIDYQDAVQGPLCYDLVSLLRDCYFKLPNAQLTRLLKYSFDEFKQHKLMADVSYDEFTYWFDLTGLQRHLKAAGIFCRLYLRDGKKGYLDNIVPTLDYIIEIAAKYDELQFMSQWVANTIKPKVIAKLKESRQ